MNDGKKKKPPKHQNKIAFKIVFDQQAQEIHKKVSFKNLCKRCTEQLEWKIQYNKYKKMKEAGKCILCTQKNVYRSYMKACEPCTEKANVCPKCLQEQGEQTMEQKKNKFQQQKQEKQSSSKMTEFIKTLKQRSRRTVNRLYQKGTIVWSKKLNTFVDEEGTEIPLQFRKGYGQTDLKDDCEDDEFGDEDEDEDNLEKETNQK